MRVCSFFLLLKFRHMTCSTLPACTFQSCPVCLSDAGKVTKNLEVYSYGKLLSVPFRIGRCLDYWDSQAIVAQIVGIIVKERIGYNIEYIHFDADMAGFYGLHNCESWESSDCPKVVRSEQEALLAYNASGKIYPDTAPDLMFVPEIGAGEIFSSEWNAHTDIVFLAAEARVFGPAGFILQQYFFMYPEVAEQAWTQDRIALDTYKTFTTPQAGRYFDTVQHLLDTGLIEHEVPGCDFSSHVSHASYANNLLEWGWTCVEDGWWLTPACSALGANWKQECIPLLDDSWTYPKPEISKSISTLGLRLARVTLGYDLYWELVYYKSVNALFLWWFFDSQFTAMKPVKVNMPQAYMLASNSLLATNMGWLPVLDSDEKLAYLLANLRVSSMEMDKLMDAAAAAQALDYWPGQETGPQLYQKLACDFLREHRSIWEQAWLPDPRSCSLGHFYNENVSLCQPCPSGTYSFRDILDGIPRCLPCTPGHFCPEKSAEPEECPAGSFTTSYASASCERCPAGKFRPSLPKNASCQVCPGGTTTLHLGAESLSDCLCGKGYYLKPGANIELGSLDVCAPCPEGMICAAGSQYDNFAKWQSGSLESKSLHLALPQVELGFMTLASKPLEVYKCLPPDICPGGPPASCGNGRDNKRVACGNCPDGQVKDGNTCSECGFMDKCTFFLFLLSATIFAFVGYYAVSSKLTAKLSTMLAISMVFGSLVGLVQTLGVFSLLSTPWPSDFRHFLAAMSIFAADFDALTIGCAFSDFSPVVHFASTCFFFPYVILALCIFYPVSRLFAKRFVWTPENAKNVMGAWCQISFTSMCGVGSSAFVLVEHPMGSSSVVRYTELLTSSSEYVGVAILGSSVLALALTFFCICMYALVRAPKKAAEGDTRFLQSCRFLLVRFRVDVWWWGLHMMSRSLLISLCPIIATGEPRFQMIMICIIISASVLATSRFRPWRAPSLNAVDISICFVLMMLVLTATAFVDKATGSWADFYTTLLYVLTAIAFCIMLFMVCLSASAVFQRGPIGTIYDVAPCQTFPDPAKLARSISQLSEEAALRPVEMITQALREMQVYDLWLLSKSLSTMLETGILAQERPLNWRQMSVRTSSFTKEVAKEGERNLVAEEPDSGNTNLHKESEPDPEDCTI